MAGWTQPTLGGSSLNRFYLGGSFHWPTGWSGWLSIRQEGEAENIELFRFTELNTPELLEALDIAVPQLRVLLGDPRLD